MASAPSATSATPDATVINSASSVQRRPPRIGRAPRRSRFGSTASGASAFRTRPAPPCARPRPVGGLPWASTASSLESEIHRRRPAQAKRDAGPITTGRSLRGSHRTASLKNSDAPYGSARPRGRHRSMAATTLMRLTACTKQMRLCCREKQTKPKPSCPGLSGTIPAVTSVRSPSPADARGTPRETSGSPLPGRQRLRRRGRGRPPRHRSRRRWRRARSRVGGRRSS